MQVKYLSIIFILLFIVIFYIYSNSYIAFFLLLFTIGFFVLSFLSIVIVRNKVDISIHTKEAVFKNESMSILIELMNRSFLPVVKAEANVRLMNSFTGEVNEQSIVFSLPSKRRENIRMHLLSEYSGKLHVTVESIIFYDLLGIFSYRKKINEATSYYILPTVYDVTVSVRDEASFLNEDFDHFINKIGIGREYFNLKEYTPGDNIKEIHWKLSSKLDEIVVKENSETVSESFLILFETSYLEEKRIITPKLIDAMLEVYLGITKLLIEHEKIVSIGWLGKDDEELRIIQVGSLQELHQLYSQILNIEVQKSEKSVLEKFSMLSYEIYSHVIYVTIEDAYVIQADTLRERNIYVIKAFDDTNIETLTNNGLAFVPKQLDGYLYELTV